MWIMIKREILVSTVQMGFHHHPSHPHDPLLCTILIYFNEILILPHLSEKISVLDLIDFFLKKLALITNIFINIFIRLDVAYKFA